MHRAKIDANHCEIKEAFEWCGFSVKDCRRFGEGFPDLVLGRNGYTHLAEIKTLTGKLNKRQLEFIAAHRGSVYVVRTVEDVNDLSKKLP